MKFLNQFKTFARSWGNGRTQTLQKCQITLQNMRDIIFNSQFFCCCLFSVTLFHQLKIPCRIERRKRKEEEKKQVKKRGAAKDACPTTTNSTQTGQVHCLARWAARRPTWAWKPDLMLATEHVAPQFSHFKKNKRSSLTMLVSGERHVWHVTYSSIQMKKKNPQNHGLTVDALLAWTKVKFKYF